MASVLLVFLKDEYITTFRNIFDSTTPSISLPIYYAGGTAQKDISSEDIIDGLGPVSFNAQAAADRDELLNKLKIDVQSGDCVLVMGARDPSLPAMVSKIVILFGGEQGNTLY